MVGKNNFTTYFKKTANKKQRFTLKKLSVGLASVAVGATLFLGSGEAVSAEEPGTTTPGVGATEETTTQNEDPTPDAGANNGGLAQGGATGGENNSEGGNTNGGALAPENNENGYLTKEAAEAAAQAVLESNSFNNSYSVSQGANGRWYYQLSPNPAEDDGEGDGQVPAENNETGYSTKEAAEAAAQAALESNSFNNSYSVSQGANGRWYYVLSPNLPEESDDDTQEPGDDVEENNETGYSTKEAAEAAAQAVLEDDPVNNSFTVSQGANGRWYYLLSPNPATEIPDEPGEEEAVYTLYYYAQQTKGKNGATTVKAKSAEEAEKYFRNWANENDLGALDWSYDPETKTFTAREKVEDPDEEPGEEEAVYTLYYFAQQTKGKNGATTVKANSAEEAEKYFRKWANENDLGDLDWSYDPETKTFTAREKVQDPGEEEPGKPGEEEPGEEKPGKPGEEEPGEEKPGKPGEEKPGKPGEEKPGKPGEEKPGKPGEEKPGKPGDKEEPGQTLPDTATSAWALGLLGLTSLAGGLFAHKNKED